MMYHLQPSLCVCVHACVRCDKQQELISQPHVRHLFDDFRRNATVGTITKYSRKGCARPINQEVAWIVCHLDNVVCACMHPQKIYSACAVYIINYQRNNHSQDYQVPTIRLINYLEILELLVALQTFLLCHATMNCNGGKVLLRQQCSKSHTPLHGLDEYNHLCADGWMVENNFYGKKSTVFNLYE